VGGQQTIRSYWRNYFEQTDGLIWVVDSADRVRLNDCARELNVLMDQEKLAGASLMIFANKQDLAGALTKEEIAEALQLTGERFKVRWGGGEGGRAASGHASERASGRASARSAHVSAPIQPPLTLLYVLGADETLEHHGVQRGNGGGAGGRDGLGGRRHLLAHFHAQLTAQTL
jgi:hypothetical protein